MHWKPELAPRRIFVGLDGMRTLEEVRRTVRILGPLGVNFKARLPLFVRFGGVQLARAGLHGKNLFADLKLHDIGNSMKEDVAALIQTVQPGFISCHANNTGKALRTISNAVIDLAGPATKLIGVTVLTDMDSDDCVIVHGDSPQESVNRLVRRALEAGIDHVVCSPREVAILKERLPDATVITPGIRPQGAPADDQARSTTASLAVTMGADYLVIGRPILQAADPVAATQAFIDEIRAANAVAA